jgi:uncharacterized membrane protein
LVEPALNTVAYFFHEKFWMQITERRARHGAPVATALTPAQCT